MKLFMYVTLAAFVFVPLLVHAGACADRLESMPRVERHCAQLDTSVSLEGNPFVYTNPDAGCDVGLSMPGLPSFGGGNGLGLDSCQILKNVTGDLVKEINTGFQDAVDDSLGEMAEETHVDVDANEYISDQVNGEN